MKITVGNYEVYNSGIITSFDNADVLFNVASGVVVRLRFKTDESNQQNMQADINESGELVFTLTNFNNPLGTEFTKPLEIGLLEGSKFLLHIKVLGNQNSSNRTILYTWLKGGAVNDGQ